MRGKDNRLSIGWVMVLAAAASTVAAVWLTVLWAHDFALDSLRQRSAQTLRLTADNLGVELDRFIFLPRVLSTNPSVLAAVDRRADGMALSRADRELEQVEAVTGAADIFLYDIGGKVIAGRTADGGDPGIGADLSDRPFFRAALEGRLGRYFTAYPENRKPVYAFAYAVRQDGEVHGVVVVVVDLERPQDKFKLVTAEHEIIIQDRNGVIFLSSRPDWRLRSVQPLTAETRSDIERDGRYRGLDLPSLGLAERKDGLFTVANSNGRGPAYLRLDRNLARADWMASILVDTAVVNRQVAQAGVVSAFAVSSLFLLLIAVYQRRRRIAERMALQAEANARLEVRVRERTSELLMSNRRLRALIEERDRAELELRQAQQELIQASKLAALGQMSAGLSHELNQPLSAIRSYADNAVAFLERENTDRARSNLSGIAELTERMARIIRNLRTYARNEQTPIRPVSVKDAITSASLLLESKARSAEAEIRLNLPQEELVVMGGDVRLQQVFVNLLSNAIDAVETGIKRLIDVTVERRGDELHCRVADTGPGIPENEIGSVFDPFFSTKAVGQGMGLGLSITIGIVEQFGGRIVAGNRPEGGAEFLVVLRLAEEGRSAAE